MNILSFCPEFGIPINDYFMQNSSYSITFLFITPFYFLHNFKYKCIKQQLYIYINVHTMHKDVIFDNDNKGGRNYTNEWKSFSHIRLFETPMDYTVHGILQARILEWVAFPFSRGSSQGSNPGLLHFRQILYQLSHKGSPIILEWVAYPFSSRSSWPKNQTRVSSIASRFFTNWAI